MKVYKFRSHDKAMSLVDGDKNDERQQHCLDIDFDGSFVAAQWSTPNVKTNYKRQYKDFPSWLPSHPVISIRVKKIIEPFVSKEVEFLPLLHDELELYMLNVTNVLDCIDWQRSIKSVHSNSIIRFDKQVFDFSKIPEDTYMFKIKENAVITTYITDHFKNLIEQHKIKGLDYSTEFDSEFTLEKEQEVEGNHEAQLRIIEEQGGEIISFAEARKRVVLGKAVASGRWKMQNTNKGGFVLGELRLDSDLSYRWFTPIHIPPILTDRLWYEVERSNI